MKEMMYSEFVELYESLAATSKRLEKVAIMAVFLKKLKEKGKSEWIFLLKGRVVPEYDSREIGISGQLTIKAIAKALGIPQETIVERYRKVGDLGVIAQDLTEKKKQVTLFSKKLSVSKVFENIKKLVSIEGKGTVDKKMSLIAEIIGDASPNEAKYIVRTLLSDLRIGVADGIIRDSISLAFFPDEPEMNTKIQEAYDLANDFSIVFQAAIKGKEEFKKITVTPGKPINVMLAVKAKDIDEAFEICGKPAAFEYKYDGFRLTIHKYHGEITLFTRRLENVSIQFPDVVKAIKENIKADSFILDAEVVGYDPKTKKYLPFQAISQRIKRKYYIEKLLSQLPVELNIFDVLYYNGQSTLELKFIDRRKIIEKIVSTRRLIIRPAKQIVTSDVKKAQEFYEESLEIGEEGVMIKKIDAPYQQGRKVGYMAKLKPELKDLDLVIVGAEYGSGKRGGWLTSYIVACKNQDEFLEIGKVSSGLKEIEGQEGATTYEEMTRLLKPLIEEEKGNYVKIKPKIVVSVTYQNIQKSPSYSSGYALRFPRIATYRPDKGIKEIESLKDIEKLTV